MPDWKALSLKALEILKKAGALIKQEPLMDRSAFKNEIKNSGSGNVVVNQVIFAVPGQLPDQKTREQIQKLFATNQHALDSLQLSEKKNLLNSGVTPDRKLLDFVLKSLPPRDHSLWETGLLLRGYFERREKELVAKIKDDMIATDSIRGKNIANLCTAGYLESEIIPMHNALTDLERLQDFAKFYEALVTQTPTSIFVGITHTEVSLKEELAGKIKYALTYSAPYVKVHAMARRNVDLATNIILEARKNNPNIKDVIYSLTPSHLDATIILKN